MGILKQAALVCVCLAVINRVSLYFEPTLPHNFGGFSHPDFQDVADVFRANTESGTEPGGAFAVYYKGELVVDLWGGYADVEAQRVWTNDTTTLVFSCTKGVAAIVMAKMVQDGVLDYSKPVSDYWPEFGQAGKDNITVEMLISHQGKGYLSSIRLERLDRSIGVINCGVASFDIASLTFSPRYPPTMESVLITSVVTIVSCLVGLDEPLSIHEFKANPEKVKQTLARQHTAWPAGSRFGYHAMTYGLYVDQLIQHADPKGRDTDTVFQEDIARPLDIDFHMNLPLEQFHRTARLYPRTRVGLLMDAFRHRRYLTPMYQIVFHPESLMAKSVAVIDEFTESTSALNNPQFREVTMSSLSGTGTARGMAKLYAIVANYGELNGQRVLSRDYITRLATPVVTGMDNVMMTGEETSIGPGTLYHKNPMGELTVGHTGHGGQVAVADIKNDLGIAYISNHLTIHGVADDPRYQDLEAALYKCLDKITGR